MINCKQLFENITIDSLSSQKKIQVNSVINVYYGKTIDNKLRLSFLSNVVPPVISSTRMITIYQISEGTDLFWTCFDLVDIKASSIFYHICDDLILSITDEYDEKQALNKIKNRFDLWKKVLTRPVNNELSIDIIKGLFGELYFLDKYLIDKYGNEQAIKSWVGPEGYPKDFSINNTWYEIKTTSINSNSIKINSIGQLDSSNDGFLTIIRVESMSEEYSDGLSSLWDLINDIFYKLDSIDLRDVLLEKLLNKGYSPFINKDIYKFRFVDMNKYLVNDEFPRLKKDDIKYEEIEDAKYSLRISSLERFKVC